MALPLSSASPNPQPLENAINPKLRISLGLHLFHLFLISSNSCMRCQKVPQPWPGLHQNAMQAPLELTHPFTLFVSHNNSLLIPATPGPEYLTLDDGQEIVLTQIYADADKNESYQVFMQVSPFQDTWHSKTRI